MSRPPPLTPIRNCGVIGRNSFRKYIFELSPAAPSTHHLPSAPPRRACPHYIHVRCAELLEPQRCPLCRESFWGPLISKTRYFLQVGSRGPCGPIGVPLGPYGAHGTHGPKSSGEVSGNCPKFRGSPPKIDL